MQIQKIFMRILFVLLSFCVFSCSGLQSRYHEVKKAETWTSIASQYEVPVDALRSENRAVTTRGLAAGAKVYIPFEESPRWDEQWKVERVVQSDAIFQPKNGGKAPLAYNLSTAHFTWPVEGTVSSHFGRRRGRQHEGIDIVAKKGTPVKSARSGHVIYATNRISGYGNMIIVRHSDAFSTVYAHLSAMNVKRGQFVPRGYMIGRVGRTGHATGNHLHFEIRNHSKPVNPFFFLQGQLAANTVSR